MIDNLLLAGAMATKIACITASSFLYKWEYVSPPTTTVGSRIFDSYRKMTTPKSANSMTLKVTIIQAADILFIISSTIYAIAMSLFFGGVPEIDNFVTGITMLGMMTSIPYLIGYITYFKMKPRR